LWADKLIREEVPEVADIREIDVCSYGIDDASVVEYSPQAYDGTDAYNIEMDA
jgi:hypothetical protein